MKVSLYRPFYETFTSRPDSEAPPEVYRRQPRGRSLSWHITFSYPSPPMSSPPSPERKPIDHPTTTSSSFSYVSRPTTAAVSSTTSAAICLPPIFTGLPAPVGPRPLVSPSQSASAPPYVAQYQPRTSTSSNESQAPLIRTESASSASAILDVQQTAGPSASSASSRGGRRSKTHVANACNNCKRAHLSCDVERPCNRCVQTGKADTCRDVPHKKRGRPRLRDENEFKVQQLGSNIPVEGPSEFGPSLAAIRGSAASRHRRTGSLRTLRSYPDTSEMSPVSESVFRPNLGPAFTMPPREPRQMQGFVTPVAFLDLDLTLIKANPAFQDLMGSRDIRNVPLSDIARTVGGDSFQNARNALRAEREAKEPAYLPPIFRAGLDPASGITDQDIDEITRGFDDQHYTWIFLLAGGVERSLDVRLRLAKTSHYFAALLLPPLQQTRVVEQVQTAPPPMFHQPHMPHVPPPPPMFQGSPQQMTDPRFMRREPAIHSSPPSPFYHPLHVQPGPYAAPMAHASSRSYPPFETQHQYFPPPQLPQYPQQSYHTVQTPTLHPIQERPVTAESTSAGVAPSPFTSPTSYRQSYSFNRPRSETLESLQRQAVQNRPRSETLESLGRHVQTRLRADSGVTTSTAPQSSPPQQYGGERSRGSSDSDESGTGQGQSPRKRRRMNLDEVLHRR